MFISISSFFSLPLISVLPAIWIGFVLFQCMSPRNFFASVFGTVTPWIFYMWFNLEFQPDLLWFENLKNELTPTIRVNFSENHSIAFLIATTIILLISIGMLFNSLRLDSIQTRQRMKLFIWILLFSGIATIFYSSSMPSFLSIAAIAFSMLMAHPLTHQKSLLHSYLFILLFVVNITFVIVNFLHYIN